MARRSLKSIRRQQALDDADRSFRDATVNWASTYNRAFGLSRNEAKYFQTAVAEEINRFLNLSKRLAERSRIAAEA